MFKTVCQNTIIEIAMRTINLVCGVCALLLMGTTTNFAQQSNEFIELKGKIIDAETNEKIVQATITLAGTNLSTVSNLEGKFSLKIPESKKQEQLIIEAIGLKKQSFTLPDNLKKLLRIEMDTNVITLDAANIVAYSDPKELVKRVFKNREKNYLNNQTLMTAFYRETIKKRSKNASLAEAVVNIYKQPYDNNLKDKIEMIRSRKNTDYSRLDTIALKLQGGPFSTLFVDVVKYPEYIFTPATLNAYNFNFGNLTEINGENVFVVQFKQRPEVLTPLYEGNLYIAASSLALVKATYSLKLVNVKEVNEMFVKSKPASVKIKPRNISYEVNYREKNGRWLYGYSKADLSFEVKKQRRLFKSIYTLSCEMAVTDWKLSNSLTSGNEERKIDQYIIMADQNIGFGDPDFWGEYNVIEPEKSIESAIKKIKRKLDKDEKSSTGLGSR